MEQKRSKCFVKGHKGNDVVFVCIYEGCPNKNRVACLRCIPQHKDHVEFMINIDDIINNQTVEVKGWPTFDQSQEILTSLQESQNYIEQKQKLIISIQEGFQDLQKKVNKEIDTLKVKMVKKVEQIYQQKIEHMTALRQLCMQSFNINFVVEQIKQYIILGQQGEGGQEDTNFEQFNEVMKSLLVDNVVKIAEIYNSDNSNNKINFDCSKFNQMKKDITKLINNSMDFLSNTKGNIEFSQNDCVEDQDAVIQDISNIFQTIQKIIPDNLQLLPLTYGIEHFENGSIYEGFSLNGIRQFIGCFYFQGGDKYIGEWINGARQGRGQYYYEDGEIYQGQWRNDVREGYGKEFYKNGKIKYEGNFVNDKYEGQGKYYHVQGDIFQGQFKNNKPEGFGILHSIDGIQHTCFYKDGNKCSEQRQ